MQVRNMPLSTGLKKNQRTAILSLLAGLIGFCVWTQATFFLPLLLIALLLCQETNTRYQAFCLMFVYYLASSRGIIHGASIFFKQESLFLGIVFWVSSSFGLALPFLCFFPASGDRLLGRSVKRVLAMVFHVIPPLGLIGWTSPLLGAAVLFPSVGLFGLVLIVCIYLCTAEIKKLRVVLALIAFFLVPFFSGVEEKKDPAFIGIDTSFGKITSGSGDFAEFAQRQRLVFQELYRLKREGVFEGRNYIVLPETIAGRLNNVGFELWERQAGKVLSVGQTLLYGGEIPSANGLKYDNVMISTGATQGNTKQKIPVPISMFVPFSSTGANAYLWSRETLTLDSGRVAAVVICYEQYLMWPYILMFAPGIETPTVIIATANQWWSRETSLPTLQRRTRYLWSRLLGVPVAAAENI